MSQFSLNNRIIVEAFKNDKSLRAANAASGFATIAQKSGLKGLRVLIGTTLTDGREIPAGSTAFVREEILHNAPWAKVAMDCEAIPAPFFIVEMTYVDFISTPGESQ